MSDAPYANPTGPAVGQGEDPGKTLGLVGLILAIFANVVGLIISIIAFRKSKQAGFSNGLAKAGIVIGSILFVISLALGITAIVATVTAVNEACAQLGPGTHQAGNTTVTCPG
jgi:Ca2+/H+ antiporter